MGWKKKKKNKYRNKKVSFDGITFHSLGECKHYQHLKLLESRNIISNLELQKKFELKSLNGAIICRKIIDFVYIDNETGQQIADEFKGFMTREEKLKLKLFEDNFPNYKLIITKK